MTKGKDERISSSLGVSLSRCTGCRACELACSFHLEDVFQPSQSAIHVTRHNDSGEIDLALESGCDLCEGEAIPQCVKYCAANALSWVQDKPDE